MPTYIDSLTGKPALAIQVPELEDDLASCLVGTPLEGSPVLEQDGVFRILRLDIAWRIVRPGEWVVFLEKDWVAFFTEASFPLYFKEQVHEPIV